jgi:cobalt-zinc-cadmium efflux system outer membrane protein
MVVFMNRKICLDVLIVVFLLISSTTNAVSQSVKEQERSQERTPHAGERSRIPGEQETMGIVHSAKPAEPAHPTQTPSSYSQFIDPANGSSADDLVRYALTHNGELAAARQMIAEARGRLRQAGLRANPMIESSGTHAVNTSDNMAMLGAELPLELGGRRTARVTVAQRELELRDAEVADFERKLAAEVRTKYANAIAAARNLKFTEDLLTLTRDSHRLVQARVERGKTAPLEQNVVFVELNRVDVMRINLQGKTEIAMLELKKSIGMLPGDILMLRGEFETNHQPATQNDALRNALASRPDLLAARAAENLAQAQIEQARTEGKVDASIFANYQRQNMGFGVRGINDAGALAPVQGIFHYATFGLRLTLPVRNQNQGNIEAAVAAAEAVRNRREFNEIVVRNEVAAAYARFDRAQQALDVYRGNVRNQAQLNLDVVQQTYTLGQKTLIDYINEQRRFVEIETGYTEALKEYFDSLVEIERAAGSPLPSA